MISFLLATTGRPEMAERCVRSIYSTTAGRRIEIVAAVDRDHETKNVLRGLGCYVSHAEDYRGAARAWNEALSLAEGPLYVLAADDLVFRSGWCEAALESLSAAPDSLIGFNDGHWGEELSTHYLLPRSLIVEVLGGVVAWECYGHSFHDKEANERARRAGRYVWCEGARVDHVHWLFGDRTRDETDERVLGTHPEAEAEFSRRAAAGFPDEQAPAIA